jgi:hypothetical protein
MRLFVPQRLPLPATLSQPLQQSFLMAEQT